MWAAAPGLAGARDMLGRLVLDQSRVTEEAVAARAAAMEAGADSFAAMFPAPRTRWVDDLTLSPTTLAAVHAPVLLVHGAQDRLTPLPTAALPLLDHLADVRLHVPRPVRSRAAAGASGGVPGAPGGLPRRGPRRLIRG